MISKEETIKQLQAIVDENKRPILVTAHIGTIIHALKYLKEQEAKPVVDIADTVDGIEVGRCPSCDRGIVNNKSNPTRYCKFCGQAVKWDD